MNFKQFDPEIGVEGYCSAIHDSLYPNAAPESIDLAGLRMVNRVYAMGSIFSRVRSIREVDIEHFLSGKVLIKEFLPPKKSVAPTSVGRFNYSGERKLYLADHPYVALMECGIKPGDYFLYSYFSFKVDAFFVEANVKGSTAKDLINSLFQSEDGNFYEVINRVYEKYFNYEGLHGVVYDSVRVQKGFKHETWGDISSTSNLAIKEQDLSLASFMGGWLARCDDHYRPVYLRSFSPMLNPKKKSKLSTVSYHQEKPKFKLEYSRVMKEVNRLRGFSKLRLDNCEFSEPPSVLVKVNYKD
ncbi:hypothetical protein [Pseudomonas sp. CFBP13508]|uniref:hypothetical protein n=1 Tax=Pseudomonas sp. CFBP13508 TaxID=2184009 RepID=UPI0010C1580A|nr:hypothetical protein [Pseudomonas sp. CFBP13508]